MRDPWLGMVFDRAAEATTEEITEWLRTSPWGRCVYRCDNDAVDRQVLAMEFEGGVTGTFTMTAFENGRHIEVYGTRGVFKGGETYRHHFGAHLVFFPHEGEPVRYTVQDEEGGYELHGGGDAGLVNALYDEMTKPPGALAGGGSRFHRSQSPHDFRCRGIAANRACRRFGRIPATISKSMRTKIAIWPRTPGTVPCWRI